MSAFYDRGYESCGKTEQKLTDFFLNMENLRTLSVLKGVYGLKYIFVRGNNAF